MTIPHVAYGADAKSAEQNALIDQCNATRTQTDQQQTTIDNAAVTIGQHDSRLTTLESEPDPTYSLDALTDVTITAPTSGQGVTYNGTGWVNGAPAPAAHQHAISSLADVDTTTSPPASGQVLKWNGTRWAPATDQTAAAGSGATKLDELTDVDLATTPPADKNALVFSTAANQWVPQVQQQTGQWYGQWTDNSGGAGIVVYNASGGGGAGLKHTDIGVPVGTPVGCSLAAGTFTPDHAGLWSFEYSAQYQGSNTSIRAIYLAKSTASNSPAGIKYGLVGGPTMDAQSTSASIRLNAGESVSVYVAVWTANASVTVHRAQGNLLTATWHGPLV